MHPAVVWGALDCPSYPLAAALSGRTCLLGTFSAVLLRDVTAGERLVAVGWTVDVDGRKHGTASALLDASGAVVAGARAVWIAVPDDRPVTAG